MPSSLPQDGFFLLTCGLGKCCSLAFFGYVKKCPMRRKQASEYKTDVRKKRIFKNFENVWNFLPRALSKVALVINFLGHFAIAKWFFLLRYSGNFF